MVEPYPLPPQALLNRYREGGRGYTDCFVTEVDLTVTHAAFVEAFYTTAVFKLERFVLRWAVKRPSTDAQARELARGTRETFAAWHVEARAADQLLLCDLNGSTRSWLMVQRRAVGTQLLFGSAVVARVDPRTGRARLGLVFRLLLGFHKLYSRILLAAARSRVIALRSKETR